MTDQTTTISVPFTIRKRGGRKLILTPDGTPASPPTRSRPDSALLKALARGFRWQKMLREGYYQTLEEIADAENINPSYVSRLLRMTLLAPEIVEAILAGSHPAGLTRAKAMQPFPMEWSRQRINFH
jgi:DNA-binding CsgD family transcriptional regulator